MVLALRESEGHAAAMRLSHGFMAALWADDADINDAAVLDGVAARLGFDGPRLRERAQDPAIAALFDADTERAMQAGSSGPRPMWWTARSSGARTVSTSWPGAWVSSHSWPDRAAMPRKGLF